VGQAEHPSQLPFVRHREDPREGLALIHRPGYTLTNLTKVILDNNPVLRDEWLHRIPMGRLADPSDLKGTVVLLGSDASKYITGAEIVVDGGYTCL
jgi:D-arabinitol 2-dehydrogenase